MKRIFNRHIHGLKVFGVDMSPRELALANKSLKDYQFELIEGRAQSLPLLSSSVDFIFCHMALMFMDELDLVISEIHRCLKPGGALLYI